MNILQPQTYPGFGEMVIRLLISILCGFAIGLERSKRFKEAGLRTHIFTCFASAIFMLVSKYAFLDMLVVYGEKPADYARVAAGVVSGISFLCAGVIYKIGVNVHGLTTAVGLWLTSAIGLSIGAGMYGIGILGAAFMVGIQYFLHCVTFGTDSYNFTDMKIVTEETCSFETIQKLILEETGGMAEDVSAVHEKELSTYEFKLRTKDPIGADQMKRVMEKEPGIRSVSHKSVRKS